MQHLYTQKKWQIIRLDQQRKQVVYTQMNYQTDYRFFLL